MESYGALLKSAREAKGLSIEEAERETSITRQYLEALEKEREDIFPGEPYLVGFLKNYASYLGLNDEEIINLYHAKIIQESPVPKELLEKKPPKFLLPLIITLSSILLIGGAIYLYIFVLKIPQRKIDNAKIIEENKKIHKYELGLNPMVQRLYTGDQISLPTRTGEGYIVLTVQKTLEVMTLRTPTGDQIFQLGEERGLDIDGDNVIDFVLSLRDISRTDERRGAQVSMWLQDIDTYVFVNTQDSSQDNYSVSSTSIKENPDSNRTFIHEDNRAYPFTVNITFRAACVFRYRDDNNNKVEDYYTAGQTLSIRPKNRIRMWMSNANSVQIQISAASSSYSLDIGKSGQILVEDIKWLKSDSGKYSLVVEGVE